MKPIYIVKDGNINKVAGFGESGGGHVIENQSGIDMAQRSNLQFLDAQAIDDSTNDVTIIENVQIINNESELDDLPDGIYMGSYDDTGSVITASIVSYDNTTSELVSINVQDAIDEVVEIVDNKVDNTNISSVETTNTATSAHPIDSYFINASGQLVRATSNIAIGDTISGSNTIATTISDVLKSANDNIDAILNVYGGKNLFVVNAIGDGGLTAIKNTDGTISISAGTTSSELLIPSGNLIAQKELAKQLLPNTKYIFSIGTSLSSVYLQAFYLIEGESYQTLVNVNDVNQVEFTTPSIFDAIWVRIAVPANMVIPAITVYPMLRDARITDNTYVPYTKTNKELTDETNSIAPMLNLYGSKNLWDIDGWLNKIGQTFTKSGNAYSIPITDLKTYDNPYVFADSDIRITASIDDFSGSMFDLQILNSSNEVVGSINNTSGLIKTVTCTGCKIRLAVAATGTFTFTAPMIRDSRVEDSTYIPYAMTNRELTEKKQNKTLDTSLPIGMYNRSTVEESLAALSNMLGAINTMFFKSFTLSPNASVNTGIPVNAGAYGRTIFVIASGHGDVGDATGSEIGMIRCGYNGDFLQYEAIRVLRTTLISSVSVGTDKNIVITAGVFVAHILLISNR